MLSLARYPVDTFAGKSPNPLFLPNVWVCGAVSLFSDGDLLRSMVLFRQDLSRKTRSGANAAGLPRHSEGGH
jgi:hypothetical protein